MDQDTIRVSVCSPIHNEKENLPALVDRVHRTMIPLHGHCWEQVLVDDGSTDGSAEVIAGLSEAYPCLVSLKHPTNLGERAAWSTAFQTARGEVVAVIAGDLQLQPEDIPRLLDVVFQEGFDVGTGERVRRKDGLYYWSATRILNLYMRVMFGLDVKDVSSSFFAARSRFVKGLPLAEHDHRYILAILKRRGARIKEVPVEHGARMAGRSHYTRWKVLWAIPEVVRFTARHFRGFYDL